MVAFLSLLITALNPHLAMCQSNANANVMTVDVPSSNNFVIGMTLDASLRSGRPSPFTDASLLAFKNAWIDKGDDLDQQGTFTMSTDIVTSQQEAVEALDIEGRLEVSFLCVSGDAHLSFAKESIQSASDVSVIIKASAVGRKKQLDLSDWNNLLELKDTLNFAGIEEFEALYGTYLIVGFEYGGEIVFQSTHSAQSNEDKVAIEGGLKVSFGKVGFNVAGSADVDYDKSDISRSVSHSAEWSIRPNAWGDDAQSLIASLTAISQGGMDDNEDLYEELALSAQSLLSQSPDQIKAIVIPLASVSSVADALTGTADAADTVPFMTYLNEMYMAVKGLSKQLNLVETEWRKESPGTWASIEYVWLSWDHKMRSFMTQMQVINNIVDIVENSNTYLASDSERHFDNDVITADSFMEITVSGLEMKFEDAILDPYNAMLESLVTVCSTQYTTSICTDGTYWRESETIVPSSGNIVAYVDIRDEMHFEMNIKVNAMPEKSANIFMCYPDWPIELPSIWLRNVSDDAGAAMQGFRMHLSTAVNGVPGGVHPPFSFGPALQVGQTYFLEIDMTQQMLTVTEDGVVVYQEPKDTHNRYENVPCYAGGNVWDDRVTPADVELSGLLITDFVKTTTMASARSPFGADDGAPMIVDSTESPATQHTAGYVFAIEIPRFTVEVAFTLLLFAVAVVGVVSLYSCGMCTKAHVYKEVVVESGCETEEML